MSHRLKRTFFFFCLYNTAAAAAAANTVTFPYMRFSLYFFLLERGWGDLRCLPVNSDNLFADCLVFSCYVPVVICSFAMLYFWLCAPMQVRRTRMATAFHRHVSRRPELGIDPMVETPLYFCSIISNRRPGHLYLTYVMYAHSGCWLLIVHWSRHAIPPGMRLSLVGFASIIFLSPATPTFFPFCPS